VTAVDSPGRTGRRPGNSGARTAILTAARSRFAEVGFDKASIRFIAASAGVDPALVHHYFGTKRELFVAAVDLPVDPAVVIGALDAVPLDQLGEQLLRTVVGIWDSPLGEGAVAAFRSIVSGDEPTLLRTFLIDVVLKNIRDRVDSPQGSGSARVALVASQMLGVLIARKVIGIEPLASMPIDALAAAVAPTLQRYLTGPTP